MTTFLQICSSILAAVALGLVAYALAGVAVPPGPRLGVRGARRRAALDKGDLFTATEPLLRFAAALVGPLLSNQLREKLEMRLRRADYPLGLTVDEYAALSLISSSALGSTVCAISVWLSKGAVFGLAGAALGFMLPSIQFQEVIKQRFKDITRGLPHSIEIAAMCMGAGLDFPGAIRLVSQPLNGQKNALASELAAILEELELGHTRREALQAFAERVPTPAVQDFTNAIIQADQKGNPLARVLQVQGRMLNQRRSVLAEEAAARAGVMLILPMVLLLGCILLLLMGPFLARGGGL